MARHDVLESSLASLPEEILRGDADPGHARQTVDLQRCLSAESITEDIVCLNTTQPIVSHVVSWQNSTAASLSEELVASNVQHEAQGENISTKSLVTEASSHVTDVLIEKPTRIDTTCFKDQLVEAREAMEDAIMRRLDASYEAHDFKAQLLEARSAVEEEVMRRLDALHGADLLREDLNAAKDGLEEVALDLLDASYMIGALRSEVNAAKNELEDIAMKKLDASYKADDLKAQIDIAKDELEEAFMGKLEMSYENGHLRSQLEAAKQELEQALKSRLGASQKIELGDVVASKLDTSCEVGKITQNTVLSDTISNDQHEGSNREGRTRSPLVQHKVAASCVVRRRLPTSTSPERRRLEEYAVAKRSPYRTPSPGISSRHHRTPSPGVSSFPLGSDEFMPCIRGRLKLKHDADEAQARESDLKARLRARYQARMLTKDDAHQKHEQLSAEPETPFSSAKAACSRSSLSGRRRESAAKTEEPERPLSNAKAACSRSSFAGKRPVSAPNTEEPETPLSNAKAACSRSSRAGKRPLSAPKTEEPETPLSNAKPACTRSSLVGRRPVSALKTEIAQRASSPPSRPVSKEGSTRTGRPSGLSVGGDMLPTGKGSLLHDQTRRATPPTSQNDRHNSSKAAPLARSASAGKSQLLQGVAQSLFR